MQTKQLLILFLCLASENTTQSAPSLSITQAPSFNQKEPLTISEVLMGESVLALPIVFSQTKFVQSSPVKWSLTTLGALLVAASIEHHGAEGINMVSIIAPSLIAVHAGHFPLPIVGGNFKFWHYTAFYEATRAFLNLYKFS